MRTIPILILAAALMAATAHTTLGVINGLSHSLQTVTTIQR